MDKTQLIIYQLFGTSITIALIKYAIEIAVIAIGVYLGNRWSARKAKKLSQRAEKANTPYT